MPLIRVNRVSVMSRLVPHSAADWAAVPAERDRERVGLRAGQPAHQLQPARVEQHEHDQAGDDERHRVGAAGAGDEQRAEHEQADARARDHDQGQPPPADPVDDGQPDELGHQVGHAERHRHLQRDGGREPVVGEDRRRVVDDHLDAAELREDRDAAAEDQRRAHPGLRAGRPSPGSSPSSRPWASSAISSSSASMS